mmetsp:Transcript_11417/g.20844  ORF Transcript_11417/g.20844 Transcript_11417/m.20844 type:complete len:258 (+) Transcript_11417:532-1305(+)
MRRACATAVSASSASAMVCMLVAFSFCRNSVAFAMSSVSCATAAVSSVRSLPSLLMEASNSSMCACKSSTVSVFCLRVCSLVASSVSHQPLCSASSFASSIKRTMRSLIIFLTLSNGSLPARTATADKTRLFNFFACCCKYCTSLPCEAGFSARSCARADFAFFCSSCGKYFSALPVTDSEDRISIAFCKASNSSARSFCLASKSDAFCSQVETKSARYFLSSSRVVMVSLSIPSLSAAFCNAEALAAILLALVSVA